MLPFLFTEFTPLCIKGSKSTYFPRELHSERTIFVWLLPHLEFGVLLCLHKKIIYPTNAIPFTLTEYQSRVFYKVQKKITFCYDLTISTLGGSHMRVKGSVYIFGSSIVMTSAVCFNHFKSFWLGSILVGWWGYSNILEFSPGKPWWQQCCI